MKHSIMMFFLMVVNFCTLVQEEALAQADLPAQKKTFFYTLDNGLSIIVYPCKDQALAAVQLWYKIGSKHEKDGQRGIAHFIEHLIFKGTTKLSESDIPALTNKLSGYCNAFTSYDYTGYLFDIPVANWDKVLPVMADCMQHCTFKQEHINSEMKAVIQELKMNRDNYARSMWFEMITNLFESHPYHYPIIGYKQDLWSVSRDTLLEFYQKYYTPDNAALIVVGDVDPEYVYQRVKAEFGFIPAGNGWNNEQFYMNNDLKTKNITLYRKINQPACSMAYLMPGFCSGKMFQLEALSYVLGAGKGSRLHKLLVDKLQVVTQVNSFIIDLFDASLLWIDFVPKSAVDIELIVGLIQHELDDMSQGNVTEKEICRAQRFAQLEFQYALQNPQACARAIGQAFLAKRDQNYIFEYGKNITLEALAQDIQNLAANYCTQVHCHQGRVLPVLSQHEKFLQDLQNKADADDVTFLGLKPRDAVVEAIKYAENVQVCDSKYTQAPHFNRAVLENGLELVWYNNPSIDFVDLLLELPTHAYYDKHDQQGLAILVSELMLEGTKNYREQAFFDELDAYGISLSIKPGAVHATCLPQDVEKLLLLLTEMVTQATLEESAFEKVKIQIQARLKKFWDTPTEFGLQLARELVYKDHPYGQMMLGTEQSLKSLSLQDCLSYYKKYVTPQGARLVIVGNLTNFDVLQLATQCMKPWQADPVEQLYYPVLEKVAKQETFYPVNRDQTVLEFVGLSIDRMHEDYDKILLFDQILIGSVLKNSMGSRLFDLRQRTGLFYTVSGSLLYGACEQPGMILIRTIVSNDRIVEAEKLFLEEFAHGIDAITEDDLVRAKKAVVDSFARAFDVNANKLATLAFFNKYKLPSDYFERRAAALQHITLEQVKKAVKNILDINKLAVIKIGRIS